MTAIVIVLVIVVWMLSAAKKYDPNDPFQNAGLTIVKDGVQWG